MTDPRQSMLTQDLLSAADVQNKLRRMAFEILENHPDDPMALVGIHTRGVPLARRVMDLLTEHREGMKFGTIDIALYRDDLDNLGSIPSIQGSDIPFSLEGATVVLFDDVLYTGRTTRAALNVLMDYGRPKRIELAVLVDRGNRELPIRADYIGETLNTARDEHIRVQLQELDGKDGVVRMIAEEDA